MSKKPRHRRGKNNSGNPAATSPPPAWSELEQSFFAAAPPEAAEAAMEPERFDDLDAGLPARENPVREAIRRVLAALSGLQLDRRTITIAIGAVMLLIGLSAAVFAGRSSGTARPHGGVTPQPAANAPRGVPTS
jgi:hypothetical protein